MSLRTLMGGSVGVCGRTRLHPLCMSGIYAWVSIAQSCNNDFDLLIHGDAIKCTIFLRVGLHSGMLRKYIKMKMLSA